MRRGEREGEKEGGREGEEEREGGKGSNEVHNTSILTNLHIGTVVQKRRSHLSLNVKEVQLQRREEGLVTCAQYEGLGKVVGIP